MELSTLWFGIIAVLFIGFFFLEGFDYGVMMLMPFLGKNDIEKRILINAIGPHWDGNEVWLLTAGGAMFAAFPNWYATMFSGFYLPLFLILIALIFRAVAFEFRSKINNIKWKLFWDCALSIGSALPALLFCVALANLLKGVPINSSMQYAGGFFNLLSPFTILAGLSGVLLFLYHGAVFINLKVSGDLTSRAMKVGYRLGLASIYSWLALSLYSVMLFWGKGKFVGMILIGYVFVQIQKDKIRDCHDNERNYYCIGCSSSICGIIS